jgi:hypothetical protein
MGVGRTVSSIPNSIGNIAIISHDGRDDYGGPYRFFSAFWQASHKPA